MSKLAKRGSTSVGHPLSRNTLACHRCFAFYRDNLKRAKRPMPAESRREKSMQSGPASFRFALLRLSPWSRRYPVKDIFVISRGLTNVRWSVRSGPGSGRERTIYERTLNYSTGSQYPAHFYIIVYDRARFDARHRAKRTACESVERVSASRCYLNLKDKRRTCRLIVYN